MTSVDSTDSVACDGDGWNRSINEFIWGEILLRPRTEPHCSAAGSAIAFPVHYELRYAHTSQKPFDLSAIKITTLAAPAMYNAY